MATNYTKITNTYTNSLDLLTKLSASLVTAGYTQSAFVDNIIGGVNLGKKLIMTKDSKYFYLAAADNNLAWSNNDTAVSKNISTLAGCVSNTLNTSNNWFLNGPNGMRVNAEIKPGGTYFLYYNDISFIIIIKWAANTYSTIAMGLGLSDDNDVKLYQGGSSDQYTSSSSTWTRFEAKPFLYSSSGSGGDFQAFSNTTVVDLYSNHFGQDVEYSYSGGSDGYGEYPKSFNIHNGLAALLPVAFETRNYEPSFSIPNLFVIPFEKMEGETTLTLESRSYDVFPFFQKNNPVNYASTENYGCGFAIKTAGT